MSADDRDDDLEGDDQLKSLRSVWVSMRESDEDPPDRGLAALMTAAREKASELAAPPRESWWQKILATLRRPPVLALASVTVLLGGALFVMQRSDKLSSQPVSDVETTSAPAPTGDTAREVAPVTPPGANAAMGSASAVEVPAVPAEPDHAEPPPERKPQPANVVKTPTARPRPVAPPPPEEPAKIEGESAGFVTRDKGDDGDVAKRPEPATTGTATTTTRAPGRKQESIEPTYDSLGATDMKPTTAQTKTFEDSGSARSKLVTQLVKQCESAAARGDCSAVRVIAGRIKSEDSSAYAQRVVKNTSIARCLDTAATTVK